MAWTAADLDALKQLYAGGTSSVRLSDGSEVRYGPDLLERIRVIEASLMAQAQASPVSLTRVAGFRKS